MQGWQALDARIRVATRWLATAGLLLLFLNALAVVVDITLRAFFSAPIDRLSSVSAVIFFVSAACCLPAATAARRHITIRALDRLPGRAREAVDGLAALVTAVVLGMVTWQLWAYAGELGTNGRTMSQIDLPVAPFWYFVAACLGAAFLIQCFIAAQHGAAVATGRVPARVDAPAETETML